MALLNIIFLDFMLIVRRKNKQLSQIILPEAQSLTLRR